MSSNMRYEDPTECPYYLVSRVSLLMTSAFKKAFMAAGVGRIKPAYLGVLWCLWKEEGVKMIELGRCAGLEPSTMTGLLDRMERDGLVVRKPDPDDRRAYSVHLTDFGKDVKETVVRLVDETLSVMFMGIPDEEVERANTVLRNILSNAHETGENSARSGGKKAK